MAGFTERLAILVEANAGNAIAEFKKVSAAAEKSGEDVGLLGKLGVTSGDLLKAGLVAGVAGAGTAIVKFAADGVNSFTSLADEVRNFNRISGATAEESSKMVAAFHAIGISGDDATRATGMLAKNVALHGDALEKNGIAVAHNAAGNVDLVATLLNVGDAYKKQEDPAKRAEMATAAFGRQWQTMAPLLGKSREELQGFFDEAAKHHEILSQEDLDKARAYTLATHDLGEAFTGLERQLGEALVPTLTSIAKGLTSLIDLSGGLGNLITQVTTLAGLTNKAGDAIGGDANKVDGFKNTIRDFFDQIVHGSAYVDAHDNALANLSATTKDGTDANHAYTESLVAMAEGSAEDKKALDGLSKALFSDEAAAKAVTAAQRGLADANDAVTRARKDLNALLEKGAVDHKAVEAAEKADAQAVRDLASAQKAAVAATEALDAANRTLTEALQPATVAELASAFDKMTLATLDLDAANKTLADDTARYNDLMAGLKTGATVGGATADELTIAQGTVTDTYAAWNKAVTSGKSTLVDQAKAHKAYTDSVDALTKLQKQGVVTEADVAAQHAKLTRDTIAVDTATGTVTTTTQGYYDVLHKGAENDPAVIAGRKGVASATDGVATSIQHVADATDNLKLKHDALGTALAGDPNFTDQVAQKRQAVANALGHVGDANDRLIAARYTFVEAEAAKTKALSDGADQAWRLWGNLNGVLQANKDLGPLIDPALAALAGVPGAAAGAAGADYARRGGPQAAGGGIVSARTGGTLVTVGEGGRDEAIIPLPANLGGYGGGGTNLTVNLYVNGYIGPGAETQLADAVHSALLGKQRRNGSLGLN